MKTITQTLFLVLFTITLNAQTTAIPDTAFEQELVTQGIDTNGLNGNILDSDAQTPIALYVDMKGITDLTGINAFSNLQVLSCFGNDISTVNLQLPNVGTFNIDNNPNLTTLDLSLMPQLSIISARNCNISTIIPNTNFIYTQIRLGNNALSGGINLTSLSFVNTIDFSGNNISSIDVTGLTNLSSLNVDNCGLTSLDVTTNINLDNLTAIGNNLTCLDLSQNTTLSGMEVINNNPALEIVVANVAAANAGTTGIYQWWNKDASATYVTACGVASTNNFAFADEFNIYPNPVKDVLNIQSELYADYIVFTINGKQVLNGNLIEGNNVLNVGSFSKGLYFIKITSDNKSFTKKIIIN